MLNDTRIRNAKPRERDYKLTDFDGLYVLVRPNGSKLWRFAYRLNGKQKQIALGAYESARRLRAVAGMGLRYAIATGRATRDISVDLRGALVSPKISHRAAITEPSELGALLRAIEGYNGQLTTKLALQLSALLFVRPGELRMARWKEIYFDKAVWIVPAATMKMKRPHRVPLARQAIAILRELHGLTGRSEFVFPAVDSFRRCMSNNTLNAALRRLGYLRQLPAALSTINLQHGLLSHRAEVVKTLEADGGRVDGERLEGVGVTPTIEVQAGAASAGSDDAQLSRAVAVLSGT
jgi:integrase